LKYLYIVLAFAVTISCSNDKENNPQINNIDFSVENENEILAYIEQNSLNAQKSESGLYYVINEPGTGEFPLATSRVKIAYRGTFTNGVVFDESSVNGTTFNLQEVIAGWTEGIPLFKENGSGILLIPSHLAYGNTGIRGIIPPGAVLIFDVNLIAIVNN